MAPGPTSLRPPYRLAPGGGGRAQPDHDPLLVPASTLTLSRALEQRYPNAPIGLAIAAALTPITNGLMFRQRDDTDARGEPRLARVLITLVTVALALYKPWNPLCCSPRVRWPHAGLG